MNYPMTAPPCHRYDSSRPDARLLRVWAYAMGKVEKEDAVCLNRCIARLYDNQGTLIVVWKKERGLSVDHHGCSVFRQAWEEIGSETPEDVLFLNECSPEWESHWSDRQFDEPL